MKSIAFVTVGILPVPVTKGGAVETLIESLVNENERSKKYRFTVFSIYDEEAEVQSETYKDTDYVFIKTPRILQLIDKMIYYALKIIFRKDVKQLRYIFQRLNYINAVRNKLKQNYWDKVVLENHSTLLLLLKDKKLDKLYAGKILYHAHNLIDNIYGCKAQMEKIEKFIVVSNAVGEKLSEDYQIAPKKIITLKNCVNTVRFAPIDCMRKKQELRAKYSLNDNDKIIVFAGRLIPEKGIDVLLEAFNNLNMPQCKLLIIGGISFALDVHTTFQEKLQQKAYANENVILTGFVPYQEMPLYYSIGDIAVLPSLWFEPAGLTILEAMACGIPVITTNMGGIPEYVEDAAIMLKNDKTIVSCLKEEIIKLLDNADQRNARGQKSIEVAHQYNEQSYYKNFARIFNDEQTTTFPQ